MKVLWMNTWCMTRVVYSRRNAHDFARKINVPALALVPLSSAPQIALLGCTSFGNIHAAILQPIGNRLRSDSIYLTYMSPQRPKSYRGYVHKQRRLLLPPVSNHLVASRATLRFPELVHLRNPLLKLVVLALLVGMSLILFKQRSALPVHIRK